MHAAIGRILKGRRPGTRRPRARTLGVAGALLALALAACAAAWGAAAGVHASTASPAAFVVQGEKLLPNDATGQSHVGRSVALSSDGNIALVGGPHDNRESGAAWVFVREGTAWTQQAKLSAGRGATSFFGRAVALSADGTTALVGDPGNGGGNGAAWVFVRAGSTWSLQAKLTGAGEVGTGQFGRSVSLSGDGALALVGAYADASGTGAAWTFARSGSSWEQQGPKLTAAGESGHGWFGRGVALSSDGTTALIGASSDSDRVGAAWAYTRNGSEWEQQGAKLTGGGESGRGEFGEAVALSSDGSTGLVAGPEDGEGAGAAWAFTRSGSTWTQQGAKLTGGEEVPPAAFAYSVSLASDGSTALMGGYADDEALGAAWAFKRSEGSWEQDGVKLTAPSEIGQGRFGFGVALSGDASTALVGALTDNEGVGAAWVFVAPSPEEPPPGQPPPTKTEPETPPGTPISGPPAGLQVLSNTSVASPVLARTGNIEPVSGTVLVRLPHSTHFVLLTELRQVPFGTLIDATAGEVLVTTARKGKGDQSGEFFSGEFILTQAHNGTVTAILAGGSTSSCTSARARRGSARAARARRKVRKLWANAHGTFSTRGSYAVGAVQGTEWLTEDRCDGTLIRVTRDKVKVTDLVRHRSTVVHVGHSILVKP
jgi:hypothetical protein